MYYTPTRPEEGRVSVSVRGFEVEDLEVGVASGVVLAQGHQHSGGPPGLVEEPHPALEGAEDARREGEVSARQVHLAVRVAEEQVAAAGNGARRQVGLDAEDKKRKKKRDMNGLLTGPCTAHPPPTSKLFLIAPSSTSLETLKKLNMRHLNRAMMTTLTGEERNFFTGSLVTK